MLEPHVLAGADPGEAGAEPAEPSEEQRFEQIAADLRQAMQSVPELARLVENLQIERTPEGLRIQIVDQAESSMFPLGSARMYPATEALLRRVARDRTAPQQALACRPHRRHRLPAHRRLRQLVLSLDRADATRRVLVAAGLDQGRIATVIGKADTEHMFPGDPRDPRNRRISITRLRAELVAGATAPAPSTSAAAEAPFARAFAGAMSKARHSRGNCRGRISKGARRQPFPDRRRHRVGVGSR